MRKTISLIVVLVMALGCVGFIACGGRGESEMPPPDGGATPAPDEEVALPSIGGFTWDDMPVYAGAEQIQELNWTMPPEEGDWANVEWRYYTMNDDLNDVSQVSMFYKNEMPKNGWQSMGQVEAQDISYSYYSKNNEKDGAFVWIGYDEGKTVFGLMRATE